MAAIVRVKRRRDEDPANSIVIKCKKAKPSEQNDHSEVEEATSVQGVFKFAGTLCEQEACVGSHVREAIRKEKLQKEYKQHSVKISEKVRTWHKSLADKGRYKIVAEKRAVDLSELDNDKLNRELQNEKEAPEVLEGRSAAEKRNNDHEAEQQTSKRMYHLYDVVQEDLAAALSLRETEQQQASGSTATDTPEVVTCNDVPMVRERVQPAPPSSAAASGAAAAAGSSPDYVFDIYYMNNAGFDFRMFENILAVEAMDDGNELFGGNYGDGREELYDDEDDSNDEDNWRNDYPDEDPRFFENEEDFYGEDGYMEGRLNDSDDEHWGLSDMVHKGMSLGLEDADAGAASSDSEIDDAYKDEPGTAENLWTPATSYEKYKSRVIRELAVKEEEEKSSDDG